MKKELIILILFFINNAKSFIIYPPRTTIIGNIKQINCLSIKMNKQSPINILNVKNELFKMSRPNNIIGEIGLVLVGGLIAIKKFSILYSFTLWNTAFLSMIIGSLSMIINDYFDYHNGNDKSRKNALNMKKVTTEQVLFLCNILYILAFFNISTLINNSILKKLISYSLIITYIYTPILKNILIIKNVSVAFIISLTIILGGISVNGIDSLSRTIIPSTYIFFSILWRELMLDITDIEDDFKSNIKTIPIVIGKNKSMFLGLNILILSAICPFIPLLNIINNLNLNLTHILILPLLQLLIINKHIKIYYYGIYNNNDILKLLEICKISQFFSLLMFISI
tara:strand:- start:8109 stop:9128 length:1020 start_codon:yes stop_codon:yes gene_type:complete